MSCNQAEAGKDHPQEVVIDGLHEGVAVLAVEVVEDRVGAVGPPPVVLLGAVSFKRGWVEGGREGGWGG